MNKSVVAAKELTERVERLASRVGSGQAVVAASVDGAIEKKIRAVLTEVNDLAEKAAISAAKK